jgi:hypothetical protein
LAIRCREPGPKYRSAEDCRDPNANRRSTIDRDSACAADNASRGLSYTARRLPAERSPASGRSAGEPLVDPRIRRGESAP